MRNESSRDESEFRREGLPAIQQDALVAIDVGDGTLASGGAGEARIESAQAGAACLGKGDWGRRRRRCQGHTVYSD